MIDGLVSLVPAGLPLTLDVHLEARVLAFLAALTIGTAVLLGLVPALQAGRLNLQAALQGDARAVTGGSRRLVSRLLLVSQVALSLVLVVSAGLFSRTLGKLRDLDKGFDEEHLLLLEMKAHLAGLEPAQAPMFHDQLLSRVSALPGVRSASLSRFELLSGSHAREGISVPGAATSAEVEVGTVTSGYFPTIGMTVLEGRSFLDGDRAGAALVAVVNQTFARRLFEGKALGKRFKLGKPTSDGPTLEVVGVVRDVKNDGVRDLPRPMIYRPVAQEPTFLDSLEVRTAGEPALLADQVRRAVHELRPELPILGVRTMRSQVERALTGERALATLSTAFGVTALFLVCVGLYGVVSQWAAQRTREIGVRMALGATAAGVRWMVMRQAFLLVVAGLAVGLPAALAIGRLLRGFLYGVTPADPVAALGATLVIFAVAALAAHLPARRASRIDPMTALRQE
jgi:predicted permease